MSERTPEWQGRDARKRRHERHEAREQRGRTDGAQAGVHLVREERERGTEGRAHDCAARERRGRHRTVRSHEVGEHGNVHERNAYAEGQRRDDGCDPVYVLVGRKREGEEAYNLR